MQVEIVKKLKEWYFNPVLFVRECIGAEPTSQQEEALGNFYKQDRNSIRSGHGTGKDAFASWIILHFMCTRSYPKVVCTAPTNRQLQDILWSELAKWLRKSKIADEFVIQRDKLFHKDAAKEWWARAVSASVKATKEEQAETLAGFHAEHLLIVVDEASGVPDPVFIPLEGAMTQKDNRVLLIGNMTKNQGYFYDSQFHKSINIRWNKLHWDSRKSTNVKEDFVVYMKEKYGEDSNVFRIRVIGDPPLDSENTLIPLAWAISCVDNEIPEFADDEPLYLGVDVARYGEDASIIMPRRGDIILPWKTFRKMNTIDLGGNIFQTFEDTNAKGIAIDEIGVGAGVTDWLQKKPNGYKFVHGVSTSTSSSDRKRWHILRDELWWMMREKCMKQQYSFPSKTPQEVEMSNELCNELSMPSYEFDSEGAISVESKKHAKSRGIASPNIADALSITEYFNNTAYTLWATKSEKKRRERKGFNSETPNINRDSWMTC